MRCGFWILGFGLPIGPPCFPIRCSDQDRARTALLLVCVQAQDNPAAYVKKNLIKILACFRGQGARAGRRGFIASSTLDLTAQSSPCNAFYGHTDMLSAWHLSMETNCFRYHARREVCSRAGARARAGVCVCVCVCV